MKVRRIGVWLFQRQLDGKAWNPAFRWTQRRAPLVVIEDETGAVGIGEAWSKYKDVDSVLEALTQRVVPCVVAQSFANPSDAYERALARQEHDVDWTSAAAWSAVDLALWDLAARRAQQPVWRLLGGSQDRAPVYASGGLYRDDYGPDDLREEARSHRATGFQAMKMKVGGLAVDDDLLRVRAAREGLGADANLWIDAVNQLTTTTASAFWQAVRPFGVSAMQSPLPPDQVTGMSLLTRSGIPLLASEAEYRHAAFRELLDAQSVTYLQFCLTLCGGFSGAMRLDGWASERNVRSSPQCYSTAVAQAATLHFAAARPNVLSAEYHRFHDHLAELFILPAGQVINGSAVAGASPGLGIRIPHLGLQKDGSHILSVAEFSA